MSLSSIHNTYVVIIEDATGEVVKRIGPLSERQADRVEDGLSINLDHDHYSIELRTH